MKIPTFAKVSKFHSNRWFRESRPGQHFARHWAMTAACFGVLWGTVRPAGAQVNVTQHHNHLSRDGFYIDPAFTPALAAGLTRDLNFNGAVNGNVYAQPLYIEGGP